MQTNLTADSLKAARFAATFPYVLLCLAVLGTYITLKVDQMNRPALQEITPAQQQAPQAGPMQGKIAPDFELPSLAGGLVRIADYRGKVVFLNMWATWCAPCRDEMPSMQRLYETVKGDNFEMIAISIDEKGKDAVEPFAKELGLTFPILFDPKSEVANQYQITGVPETYLIDENGVILHHIIGPSQWDDPQVVEVMRTLIRKAAGGGASYAPPGQ